MPQFFSIELDTSPPHVTWGIPEHLPGGGLGVPYTIDEPELLAGSINDAVAVVEPDELRAAHALPQGGDVHVSALVRDDVWNETVRRAVLRILPKDTGSIRRSVSGRVAESPRVTLATPDRGSAPQPEIRRR